MLEDNINNYLKDSSNVLDSWINISKQQKIIIPWLQDIRIGLDFSQNFFLAPVVKLEGDDIVGQYYMQGICFDDGDQEIDILIITSKSGRVIEEMIFNFEDQILNGRIIALKIRNMEQKIMDEVLDQLKLENHGRNICILLELMLILQLDIFARPVNSTNIKFMNFFLDFGLDNLRTNDQIDLRKVNFVIEKLNHKWNESELRTILQLVSNYDYIKTIKEAEVLFIKIGGIRNIGLLMNKGKYNQHLIGIIQGCNLRKKELIKIISDVKNMVVELGIY